MTKLYHKVTGALLLAMFCLPVASPAQNKTKTAIGVTVQGQLGQTKEQQEKDHTECYRFAIRETDLDPIYVPGAVNEKALKAKPAAAVAKTAAPPNNKNASRKARRKPKGDLTEPRKKEIKARLDKQGHSEEEKLADYKKAYKACMVEKGYAVE